ncbi:MAG: hypothetical protein RSE41_01640 [Clostridia bacterium]
MDSLNQIEIQNIRHLCGACTMVCDKIAYYKTVVTDTNITDTFVEICTNYTNLKEELVELL